MNRDRDLSVAGWWVSLLFVAAVLLTGIILLTGCASTPHYPPPPQPPPVDFIHTPVCTPPTLTTGCWHQPPGQPWQFIPAPPPAPKTACPKLLAPGAYVYVNLKPYGQGWDSSPRVHGDPDFCLAIHGVPASDCHLEGWPKRLECELELIGGCPEFEYRAGGADPWGLCKATGSQAVTCDHFGNTIDRDDPQTPEFEGQPKVCANQRDPEGRPKAGFFMVAHGIGQIRACAPSHDPATCGDPKLVDY